MYAKYHIVLAKAVVEVDFPAYAIFKQKQTSLKKKKCKNVKKIQNNVILSKLKEKDLKQ